MNFLIEWRLNTRRLGRRVLFYESLDSTNTQAAALADNTDNDGVVVVADHQTAGRGQHGRSWQCPAGDGLLLSALLFPPPELRQPALLTAWAAVSVCETVEEASGLPAVIKWPNDVLVQGKKVCGILIEQGRGTVTGIGLNINQSAADLARAGLPLAGSLACLAGRRFDRKEILRLLLGNLDDAYDGLCQGNVAKLEECWQQRVGLLGKKVQAECVGGTHHGLLCGMSFAGLALEQPGGQRVLLSAEAVRQLAEW